MANPIAVTNTSPVIALVGVGELRLLDALFDRIVVPLEVWDELIDKTGATEPDELRALRGGAFHPAQPVPPEAGSSTRASTTATATASPETARHTATRARPLARPVELDQQHAPLVARSTPTPSPSRSRSTSTSGRISAGRH